MKIAIYALKYNEKVKSALVTLTNFLINNKADIYVDYSLHKKIIDLKEFDSTRDKLFSYNNLNKTFDFLIYDGPKTINGSLKKQIVDFLEKRDADYSFFDGEPKVWKKIKG